MGVDVRLALAVTCPNCRHALTAWERLVLHYWRPRPCSRCRELLVNWLGADLLWMAIMAVAGIAFLLAVGSRVSLTELILIVLLLYPTRALFVRPLRYRDFKPYGTRDLWINVLIFAVLPLALVSGAVCIALAFGLGADFKYVLELDGKNWKILEVWYMRDFGTSLVHEPSVPVYPAYVPPQ